MYGGMRPAQRIIHNTVTSLQVTARYYLVCIRYNPEREGCIYRALPACKHRLQHIHELAHYYLVDITKLPYMGRSQLGDKEIVIFDRSPLRKSAHFVEYGVRQWQNVTELGCLARC